MWQYTGNEGTTSKTFQPVWWVHTACMCTPHPPTQLLLFMYVEQEHPLLGYSEHDVESMWSEQEGTCRDAWLRLIQPLIAQVPMLTGIGEALLTSQRTSPSAVFRRS